ncbi:MAG: crotonobetainyl-CoA:carnitine CoA-transferase CaiB-like acyl-CoA transferase [Granulosicoccus sp.]|jgi:crotonobetainyl-CoA:carnitine CoA-transferase CaiB-like acyl-CoA transferase
MLQIISHAISEGLDSATSEPNAATAMVSKLIQTGDGSAKSCYSVAEYSQSAVAAAVLEVQRLRASVWSLHSTATVNRELAAAWSLNSVQPIGWQLPAAWDEYAGDYKCKDGWIRLHTNAADHRAAALAVLGEPSNLEAAKEAVSHWMGLELESAVVASGGAAAFMMSQDQWSSHEQGIAVNAEPIVAWSEAQSSSAGLRCTLDSPERPLKGIKVLDLTRVLAGPVCTRFLASLGAEVLRIDPPSWNEDGIAIETTIGKRCAGLDLNDGSERAVFQTLLEQADVLVHGYRRDALEKIGFGDLVRASINPNLIDVALNAYGWTGPWKNRRGFDSLVQMSSGIAHHGQQSFAAQKPVPLPYQALDHVTGYLMAASVVRALREKHTSGRIFSARLSLARQAKLLQDLTVQANEELGNSKQAELLENTLTPIVDTHLLSEIETTPWGDLKRLQLPYVIDGVRVGFDHPVSRLRSSIPSWS